MNLEETQTESSGWWRWPLLPFASVIGAAIGAILFTFLQWFGLKMHGGYSTDGWFYQYCTSPDKYGLLVA